MTSRAACSAVFCIGFAASSTLAAGPDYAQSWADLLESCTRYAETGRRDVFFNWDVAWPGGGVCNGDPVCEKSVMTFIGNSCFKTDPKPETVCASGIGAVTVVVAESVVADRPARASCTSAIGLRHTPAQARAGTAPWLARAVETGRLTPTQQGWRGCTWDGRPFKVIIDFDGTFPTLHIALPAEDQISTCTRPIS